MFVLKLAGVLGVLTSFIFASVISTSTPKTEIKVRTLSEIRDHFYTSNLTKNETNQKELVADSLENKDWWNLVFKERLENVQKNDKEISTVFLKVKEGYGDNSITSLNKVCSKLYDLEITQFFVRKDNLKKNLEKFCTFTGNTNSIVVLN